MFLEVTMDCIIIIIYITMIWSPDPDLEPVAVHAIVRFTVW